MITAIHFKNFKALRDTRIELGRYNLIVGPNGSGKSTLLAGLQVVAGKGALGGSRLRSLGAAPDSSVSVELEWQDPVDRVVFKLMWHTGVADPLQPGTSSLTEGVRRRASERIRSAQVYSLDADVIAGPVQLQPHMELQRNGGGLAGVLDRMRDEFPEGFERLNAEVGRLLPEFDRILFETRSLAERGFMLRTREGQHAVHAGQLSQGVLLALALLTLSHLPNPPSIIGLEEPDRGIHPRLYRDVQDALYRLSYPESFGIDRDPVQVIVTTHSPFMLDLHKEHPEEIIIAEKSGRGSEFHRLSERSDLVELLDDVSLGDAWYSGILGGVPVAP